MTTATATNNKQIIETLYANVRAGRREDVLAAFDADLVLRESESLPYGGTHRGRQAVLRVMAQAGAVFDTSAIEVDDIFAGGDKVVALVRIPLRGTDPTEYIPVADCCTLRDGKIIEMQPYYFDTVAVLKAFGRGPGT